MTEVVIPHVISIPCQRIIETPPIHPQSAAGCNPLAVVTHAQTTVQVLPQLVVGLGSEQRPDIVLGVVVNHQEISRQEQSQLLSQVGVMITGADRHPDLWGGIIRV